MTRTSLLLALVASAALAGCNNNNGHNIVAGPDVGNDTAAINGPITLPPSILASKIYRCKDNSVVYVDWLSDNKSANFRAGENDSPIVLTAPEPGKAMVADGYSLSGGPKGAITLVRPGKGSQSCKA